MQANKILMGLGALGATTALVVVMAGKRSEVQVSEAAVNTGGIINSAEAIEKVLNAPTQEDNGLDFDPLSDDVLKGELGVDVDSPVETMRTLTREVQATRDENADLQKQNVNLQRKIDQLLQMEDKIANRVENRVEDAQREADETSQRIKQNEDRSANIVNRLEQRLKELEAGLTPSNGRKGSSATANGYEIGAAGIPDGLGYDSNGNPLSDAIIWKNPMDAQVDERKGTLTMPEFKGQQVSILDDLSTGDEMAGRDKKEKAPESVKAYTIPANSTLVGSTSMTALLGRIPVNGSVVDPYPFKVIVGPENLASNGINIPNVQGIVMSGIARGDWTLGCVSGEINSMTFTFNDGTISTYPKPTEGGAGGVTQKQTFAWFSDEYGVPCVTGKRITNMASYLGGKIGLGAVSAYANALAQAERTTVTSADGTTISSLTGEAATAARNEAIGGGLDEVSDWLDDRQQQSFDAVYVPPGTTLHVHMDQQVAIDYAINGNGRKVQHQEFIDYQGTNYSSLD